jgi:hypothetical protein
MDRIPRPVAAVVLIGTAVVLAGGFLSWLRPGLLLPPGTAVTAGAHLYGARMAARSLPLGFALLALLASRERRMLGWLLALVAVIELGDGVSAVIVGDPAELAGGLVVAVAFLWAARRLLRTAVARPGVIHSP